MSEFHDSILEAMLEGPLTSAEIIQHGLALRVNSILSELDDLILLSRGGSTYAQKCIADEWRSFDQIATRAQLLASFGESQRPSGLKLIRGRK